QGTHALQGLLDIRATQGLRVAQTRGDLVELLGIGPAIAAESHAGDRRLENVNREYSAHRLCIVDAHLRAGVSIARVHLLDRVDDSARVVARDRQTELLAVSSEQLRR